MVKSNICPVCLADIQGEYIEEGDLRIADEAISCSNCGFILEGVMDECPELEQFNRSKGLKNKGVLRQQRGNRMNIQVVHGLGKVYDVESKRVITGVNYEVREKLQTQLSVGEWWGTFIPEDKYLIIAGELILELQDKRRGTISISNVKVLPGLPNYYQFRGSGTLTEPKE